jgi:hypothetical protein
VYTPDNVTTTFVPVIAPVGLFQDVLVFVLVGANVKEVLGEGQDNTSPVLVKV